MELKTRGRPAQEDAGSAEAPAAAARPGRQRVSSLRPRALDPLVDARSDPLDRPD